MSKKVSKILKKIPKILKKISKITKISLQKNLMRFKSLSLFFSSNLPLFWGLFGYFWESFLLGCLTIFRKLWIFCTSPFQSNLPRHPNSCIGSFIFDSDATVVVVVVVVVFAVVASCPSLFNQNSNDRDCQHGHASGNHCCHEDYIVRSWKERIQMLSSFLRYTFFYRQLDFSYGVWSWQRNFEKRA